MKAKNSASSGEKQSVIFCDGACSKNPGPGAWAFVLLDAARAQVVEKAGFEAETTNNRMELRAATEALRTVAGRPGHGPVLCCSDSKLVIDGITKWIHGWKRKGWIKSDGAAVLNQELWQELHEVVQRLGSRLEWKYVPGHAHILGNLRVDEMAVALSKSREQSLYEGPLAGYPHAELFNQDLDESPVEGSKKEKAASIPAEPGFAPVYLSWVDGRLERHATWNECEARVKGAKGAKFKKVKSSAEEKATLAGWGL